ncbi:MAG: metallopeptidase family protein [Acidobacteriia bacterium]|nr:metallopeptidase family protein [Terriglobia bacterium]
MKRSVFDAQVRKALGRIPQLFLDAMKNIEIVVEDWPDPDLMEEVAGERDAVLYGLFSGRPLPLRAVDDWGEPPDLIYLYRGPLEADFPDAEELAREIEITLVHEIAHYMGFDEETLKEYGYE